MTPAHVPLAGGGAQVIGTFVARPNRFVVEARLGDGTVVRAHMADRGRLVETLIPGVPVCLVSRLGENRATQWQAAAAQRADGSWASLDTVLPNRLMRIVLEHQLLPGLPAYHTVRREVQIGTSRFDFVLEGPTTTVLEVKSAGRIVAGTGLVPDAPSSRAARHVSELILLAQSGYHAALVIVAQGVAQHVTIDASIDPVLADTVRIAMARGVQCLGVSAHFDLMGLTYERVVRIE
ncbi:MAG: DNA/RNA nuclease SfsA [Roseiflexaceae bacterium]